MPQLRLRRPQFVHCLLVCALLFAFAPVATTSSATLPSSDALPSPEEIALFSSVSRWVAEPGAAPIADRVRAEREGFDAFRRLHPREARRQVVARLPWGQAIFETAQRHGLDSLLVAAIVEAESDFRPDSVSHRGAIGLMQVIPLAAPGAEEAGPDLTDPAQNLEAGARYLSYLLKRYNGDLVLTLAAYNAGPGAVSRFGGVPPYQETQRYVEKVLALYVAHHREVWRAKRESGLVIFG
jgi:soluble lytic murein transglycosylase-like protein